MWFSLPESTHYTLYLHVDDASFKNCLFNFYNKNSYKLDNFPLTYLLFLKHLKFMEKILKKVMDYPISGLSNLKFAK